MNANGWPRADPIRRVERFPYIVRLSFDGRKTKTRKPLSDLRV
jgi:hypothetical protein